MLSQRGGTDELSDFGGGQGLSEHDDVPEVEFMGDAWRFGGFASIGCVLRSLLIEFDVHGDENVHCVDAGLLIFFKTAGRRA